MGVLGRTSSWWIGDWVRYGTAKWGAKYTLAAKITGYDVHTLENMAYVASRFPFSLRREDLSWSHHFVVAALTRDEQKYLLDFASARRLSVRDLRIELKALHRHEKDIMVTAARKRTYMKSDAHLVCPRCGFALTTQQTPPLAP